MPPLQKTVLRRIVCLISIYLSTDERSLMFLELDLGLTCH